jgi:hypothetical protein
VDQQTTGSSTNEGGQEPRPNSPRGTTSQEAEPVSIDATEPIATTIEQQTGPLTPSGPHTGCSVNIHINNTISGSANNYGTGRRRRYLDNAHNDLGVEEATNTDHSDTLNLPPLPKSNDGAPKHVEHECSTIALIPFLAELVHSAIALYIYYDKKDRKVDVEHMLIPSVLIGVLTGYVPLSGLWASRKGWAAMIGFLMTYRVLCSLKKYE